MNKQEIMQEYKEQEERLLVAKILDKLEFTKTKNKIQYTDFLNLYEQDLAEKLLNKIGYKNYYFFGGRESTERKILVIYPEKLTEEMARKNHSKMISIIKIKLPNDLKDEYDHRRYLGAIIKLGIEREKTGDILVRSLGADIIVKNEVVNFLMQNLNSLTRFQSAEIEEKDIKELRDVVIEKMEISSVIISLRLDNIVGVLARTSRSKAVDILDQERVFVNAKLETKPSKQLNVGDVITIRGKGKFEFKRIEGMSKKGRYIVKFDKYV